MSDSDLKKSPVGALVIWMGLVLFLALAVVASSTEAVDLWRTPVDTDPQSPPTSLVEDEGEAPGGAVAPARGPRAVSLIFLIVLAVVAMIVLKPRLERSLRASVIAGWFDWARLEPATGDPLPGVDLGDVAEQLGEARHALLLGDARNGIVACWMRLEQGALDAGLPRLAAETAHEYTERLIASVSVEPAAMGELAALFREARFSDHALGEHHRQRAALALDSVAEAISAENRAER